VRTFEAELRAGQFRNEHVARYGYALALISANELGKARVQLERLVRDFPGEIAYLLAMADLEVQERNLPAALQTYETALQRFPDYRPTLMGYAEALLAAGQAEKVRTLLRDYTYTHAPDPLYYRLVAQAEGESGSKVESHIALAEYYYSSGDAPLAMQQLKLAQAEPTVDHYQRQRIEARMNEIQSEMDEAKKNGEGP
jgi:predicted Zn-dependent protease